MSAAAEIGASGLRSSCASIARNSSLRRSCSCSSAWAMIMSWMSVLAPIHSRIEPSVVDDRHALHRGPAIVAVRAAQAVFGFEHGAGRHAVRPQPPRALAVVRMQGVEPAVFLPLVVGLAGEGAP
jgi:hypothetical protein